MIIEKDILHTGLIISLNEYKSLSWLKLKKLVDVLKLQLQVLIQRAKLPKLKYIEIRIFFNSRHDIDNVVGTSKVFVDCLRAQRVVPDDTKGFFDYMSIAFDPKMKKKTILFKITGEIA